MKKMYFLLAMFISVLSANAQYKKANAFTKDGRTYDLGGSARFLSDGAGTAPGIYYSYGRDQGKRLFHWFDLEFLFPSKFKYQTYNVDDPTQTATVAGKSKAAFIYRYNLACYLTNPQNEESKFKAFVTGGINVVITNGVKEEGITTTPEISNIQKYPSSQAFSYGGNLGVGGIYQFTEKVGVKLVGGYNYQDQLSADDDEDGTYSRYYVFPSHTYVTLGVRFTIGSD